MNRRFIGINDLAEYLGLNINTIRSWVWQRKIPCCKMGRLVRFDLKEIDIWLKEHKIKQIS